MENRFVTKCSKRERDGFGLIGWRKKVEAFRLEMKRQKKLNSERKREQ